LVLAPPNSRAAAAVAPADLAAQLRAGFIQRHLVPACAATAAAFMPAGRRRPPARACAAGRSHLAVVQFAAGFRVLDAGDRHSRWKWPMHAWLQAMQARTLGAAAVGLVRHCGSQISARVMPQTSAWPRAMISSASWGWLMRR
jgi:hypothetical protein